MKRIAYLLTIILIVGCSVLEELAEEPSVLPKGYKVFCSLDGTKYSLWLPREERRSVNVWNSEEDAIDFAISWDKIHSNPIVKESDKYQWNECNKGDFISYGVKLKNDTP